MAFLGSIIKRGIELNQRLQGQPVSAEAQQREQLRKLLETAKNTAFGKYYGFEQLLKANHPVEAFKQEVPIHNYQKIHGEWWHKQQTYPDITWPGKPEFFALSSGTTGKKSKRIPITDDFIQSMRDVGTSLIKAIPNYDFPEELFESEILMLSSSANLAQHPHGHMEGEISGINVNNFPGWYDLFYRPGKEIAAIPDWDERVLRIAKEAPNWNIGAIAGIPSWVLLMLKRVLEYHQLESIHELWPNLTAYASGGVAFETYRKDFEKITSRPLTIMDTYLASEGFFAYTARPETMAMELALSHGYFYEFIPFDERGVDEMGNLLENPLSLTLDEVELEQDYVMIISTCAGTWRYSIGDTVKFTQKDPPEILITGRTKFFLNVVGSQLSEDKMDEAIISVAEEMGHSVNEYSVAALQDEEEAYYHQWIIVSESDIDEAAFREKLDASLKEANKNYAVARNKALKDIKVKAIDKASYHQYLEKGKKKGGQMKTPKVMKAEKMRDYLVFLGG